MSIDEYYDKRVNAQLSEDTEIFRKYVARYETEQSVDIFDEFYWLFWEREEKMPAKLKKQTTWHAKEVMTEENFLRTVPLFEGYEEFKNAIR